MSTLNLIRSLSHGPLLSDAALVSPSAHAELASAYAALPDRDPNAGGFWYRFGVEVLEQRALLESHGFTFTVTDSDPYASHLDMFSDVESNRHITVLSTATTGGHPEHSDYVNDSFRAVHDVFGHFGSQRGFDRHGEEAAYRRHALMFSEGAALAMATETRGQNAALIANDGVFQSEKIAVLPAEWRDAYALTPRTPAEWRAARTHLKGLAS